MESIEILNSRLTIYHGLDVNISKPTFRLVWSTNETEKRYGTFIKETEAGLYLGQETGVREVPKYFMNPNCWVLEKLQANNNNPELDAKYSYEPMYIFRTGLYPVWFAIEHIIRCWEYAALQKGTQKIEDDRELEKIASEREEFLDYLKGTASPFHGALRDREAIVVPSNYTKH